MPLIEYDQNGQKFSTNDLTIDLLSKNDNPIGILIITGRQKSGKSLILNRILGTPGAFKSPMGTSSLAIGLYSEPLEVE